MPSLYSRPSSRHGASPFPFEDTTHYPINRPRRPAALAPEERRRPSRVAKGEAAVSPGHAGKEISPMETRSWFTRARMRWFLIMAGGMLAMLPAFPAKAQGPAPHAKAYVGLFKDN